MARAGVRALEYYDPDTKKHGQAHMQARYVSLNRVIEHLFTTTRLGIMQHLLQSGLVSLEEVRDKDGGLENLFVRVSHYSLPSSSLSNFFL